MALAIIVYYEISKTVVTIYIELAMTFLGRKIDRARFQPARKNGLARSRKTRFFEISEQSSRSGTEI